MILKETTKIFTRNSRVYFATKKGLKIVRMSPRNVAKLVTEVAKKMKSCFKEEYVLSFGGESFSYTGFKIKVDGEKDFILEYDVN